MDGIGEISLSQNITQYTNQSKNQNLTTNTNDLYVSKNETESSWLTTLEEMKNISENSSNAKYDAGIDTNKKLLEALVKQCEMMSNNIYTAGSWNNLMSVYAKAKKMAMSDNPKLKDLKKAISELNGAFGSLKRIEKKVKENEKDKERKQGLPIVLKTDNSESQPVSFSTGADSPASVSLASVSGASVAMAEASAGVDVSV